MAFLFIFIQLQMKARRWEKKNQNLTKLRGGSSRRDNFKETGAQNFI